MEVIKIAKVAHEINKAYCESIGDMSQVEWEFAPEWQKKSAILGVECHIKNPNMTPKDSHDSWLKEKIKDGWIYGQVKDSTLKTHPCIVEYHELPLEQRIKDVLFTQVVKSLKDVS